MARKRSTEQAVDGRGEPRPSTPRSERPPDAGAPGHTTSAPGGKRAPVVRALVMGLFYGLIHTPSADKETFASYLGFIAALSGGLLRLVGQASEVMGTTITTQGFSVDIVRGCDGLEPIAAFVAAVLASPVAWRRKLRGLAMGSVFLWLANLVRIVTLVLIGLYAPSLFKRMHLEVWQAAFIVLAVATWFVWVQWATRTPRIQADAHA